ncbi:hypothetical protein [uncultured Brevundimonas sp.]|uniref:hypothetical protein n=1 Tax=uncultured Brevundimonas sp. TaxID=213418 RepID=UPI002608A911|nr:hypothetical protein [uncultured Brevundimonas sp.]
MSAALMDNSDHDNNGSSEPDTKATAPAKAKPAPAKPLDAKAERAARLAAALRTNLRRRKMPGAAGRPDPKDRH